MQVALILTSYRIRCGINYVYILRDHTFNLKVKFYVFLMINLNVKLVIEKSIHMRIEGATWYMVQTGWTVLCLYRFYDVWDTKLNRHRLISQLRSILIMITHHESYSQWKKKGSWEVKKLLHFPCLYSYGCRFHGWLAAHSGSKILPYICRSKPHLLTKWSHKNSLKNTHKTVTNKEPKQLQFQQSWACRS